MPALLKYFVLAPILTVCLPPVKAQQCGNCGQTPIVALYDLDVQVAKPELKGEATEGWLEWLELFWLARHANDYLFQNNKDCIRFVVGPDQDANADGTQDNYKVGATYTHLPHHSIGRGYFTTGYVTRSGDAYTLHIELQSACDKKKIAESNVSFQINTILNNAVTLAQQAASQLMPLIDKIRQFELSERKENKKFAIAGHGRELIEIIPSAKTLATGQQTEIEIRLVDCDGIPLPAREIIFSKSTDPGLKIPGTLGGIVTPAIVTTGSDGKAKAMFKMTASAGNPAIINAHILTRTPENCSDALIGSAKIDLAPAYKVMINYQKTVYGMVEMKSSDSIFAITMADEKFRSSVHASTTLYHYAKSTDKNIHIDPENPSTKTVFIDLRGYSEQAKFVKAPVISVIPLGATHKEGLDSAELVFSAEILNPRIQFSFEGNELDDFDFDFNFKDDKSGKTPDSGGVLMNKGNKDASFQKRKLTDGKSLFKTEHLIRYTRKTHTTNAYGQLTEFEFAEIVILSSF